MATERIRREDWADFLDRFSRQHDRWLVTLAQIDPVIGVQREADALPLVGITYEPASDSVAIWVGAERERHVGHVVTRPREILLEQNDAGADEALEITSDDAKTLIRFPWPMPSEMVDGILR